MKIFYAAHDAGNGAVSGSQTWRNNLYLPLVDLGHEVVRFNYDLTPHAENANLFDLGQGKFIEQNRPRLERELLSQIEEAHREKPFDLFFSYFYSAYARPEVIRRIHEMGIMTMNWYCNASYQFNLIEDIAPAYDYCLVPEKFRLDDYRRVGAHPIYCQEAANPNIYKPYNLPQEFDTTFVGERYGDRPGYIRRLLDAGIQVRVWGPGWQPVPVSTRTIKKRIAKGLTIDSWRRLMQKLKRKYLNSSRDLTKPPVILPSGVCGPALSDEELICMYSRSKINLGFSTCGNTQLSSERITQIRLRDFEVPMSGGFYMVEYMPELEEFFKIGKEIVCYSDPDDLVEKCRYYLAHDAERERIRQAGYQRAVGEHSWQNRFRQVFTQAGLI